MIICRCSHFIDLCRFKCSPMFENYLFIELKPKPITYCLWHSSLFVYSETLEPQHFLSFVSFKIDCNIKFLCFNYVVMNVIT